MGLKEWEGRFTAGKSSMVSKFKLKNKELAFPTPVTNPTYDCLRKTVFEIVIFFRSIPYRNEINKLDLKEDTLKAVVSLRS
jgi:hypothetical protein